MQTGYIYAREQNYDVAVQFDGDGQHNAEYINDLVSIIKNNNVDLCIGSRFVKSDEEGFKSTRARRLGIKLISSLIKLVTGQRIWDPTSGFRACNRKVVEIFSKSYPSEFPEPESSVRLINAGFSVKESPVQMKDRQGGVSSIRTWRNLYYMINVCLSILVESIRKNAN